ncbi:hypothetical protein DAI22_05g218200 [Oryza sativa Japonica Group]|nr:hypothetical protein DAI22_05g218200 [Oryza sativa Japonica Group]
MVSPLAAGKPSQILLGVGSARKFSPSDFITPGVVGLIVQSACSFRVQKCVGSVAAWWHRSASGEHQRQIGPCSCVCERRYKTSRTTPCQKVLSFRR